MPDGLRDMKLRWTPKRVTAVSLTAVLLAAAGITIGLTLGATPRTVHKPPAPPPPSPKAASLLLSPFTGEQVTSLSPVIAVKIDNIVYARPQTGLGAADIVYVIPVEGGLSRFMAIYSSHLPPVIGPVRSAREDDLELLRQFGTPAFAYSGAQPQLLPVVEHARIVDLYSGIAGGYYRDNSRIAPYNLYARGPALASEATGASMARDIGFRFGPAPAGGQPAATETVAYPAASFTFTWSAAAGRWLVSMDGRPAVSTNSGQLSAATVVIQHTVVRTSPYIEWGALPPYAESTGSGSALVLRDGQAFQARWSRPALDGGTTFTTATGQPMTFATGPVWVVLTQ
jgi:Protein of unknown function (DUF3048) N-terminal domain/Protein of unknown function (DUF3048) C-terminal domain